MGSGLIETIQNCIEGDRISVNRIVKEASIIAEASLRLQSRKHQHLFQFISGSTKQLALDAIAELFESDGNSLSRISQWWERIEGNLRVESEVEIEFRRLIGNQVNDYIYNRYKEKDPSLAKLIRNIKRAIKQKMVDGLMLADSNSSIHLETEQHVVNRIPLEVLNSILGINLGGIQNTVDILNRLRSLFEDYIPQLYKSTTSDVATAARNIFLLRSTEIEDDPENFVLSDFQLGKNIDSVIRELSIELYPKYVLKGKLTSEDLAALLFVSGQILRSTYSSEAENGLNFYQHTLQVFPSLLKEEYVSNYRNSLEYFVKLSRQRLVDAIRNELVSVPKHHGEGK